jgi:hypothetical protein
MKKIILTGAMLIGLAVAMNAQNTAAGSSGTAKPKPVVSAVAADTAGNVATQPKSVVDQAKQEGNTGIDTAKSANASAGSTTQKKTVKKSCCKKHSEGTPCDPNSPATKPKATGTKQD